jgi:hypothetical protein
VLPVVAPAVGTAAREPMRVIPRSNPATGRVRERRDALWAPFVEPSKTPASCLPEVASCRHATTTANAADAGQRGAHVAVAGCEAVAVNASRADGALPGGGVCD